VQPAQDFPDMVGNSRALKQVLDQIATVAASEATVLILGETGTGKELVARAIHRLSRRNAGGFIKLNCAAIPTGLLESELFGHEKGAFTGAINQKVGRMELADGGTLFLDEIGEVPLELQPKLLRVLQDQEFERLGSNRTLKVNVRLLAATNRNLAESIAQHHFRSDLYYRLSVFPILVPPLRERLEDIPLLVRHFVRKFARRMDRYIEAIPTSTMQALQQWHWPGNVRELENLMERSVILSEGHSLRVPLSELSGTVATSVRTEHNLDEAERRHIIRVLRQTGGVLSGPKGAAHRLGLKRTTLQSKMQRLKITRVDYRNFRDVSELPLDRQRRRRCGRNRRALHFSDLELIPKPEVATRPVYPFSELRVQRSEVPSASGRFDLFRQTESGPVPVPENLRVMAAGPIREALSNVIAEQAPSTGGVIQSRRGGSEPFKAEALPRAI
jgi:formate hydrogenlyase transcriptional activator